MVEAEVLRVKAEAIQKLPLLQSTSLLDLWGQGLENVSSRPRTSSRTPPLAKIQKIAYKLSNGAPRVWTKIANLVVETFFIGKFYSKKWNLFVVILRRSVRRVFGVHLLVIAPASNTALLEERSQQWRAVAQIVFDLTDLVCFTSVIIFSTLKRFYFIMHRSGCGSFPGPSPIFDSFSGFSPPPYPNGKSEKQNEKTWISNKMLQGL